MTLHPDPPTVTLPASGREPSPNPAACLVCRRPADHVCSCGRAICGELLAVLIGAGVDDCECGVPW